MMAFLVGSQQESRPPQVEPSCLGRLDARGGVLHSFKRFIPPEVDYEVQVGRFYIGWAVVSGISGVCTPFLRGRIRREEGDGVEGRRHEIRMDEPARPL